MRHIDSVFTLSEVAKILKIAPTTLRSRLQKNTIDKKYYRRPDEGVYLFSEKYILDQKKIS